MSYTVLGNNSNPLNSCLVEQYYEDDDEGIIYMQGELVEEEDCVGYRATLSKGSNSTTVELGYYYRRPTSEWYWDYAWDEECKPVIPLVFACNSSWTITQCLNANFTAYQLSNRNNGWLTVSLTLTRKLNKNERIYFGFYSDLHCPVWTNGAVNNCWYNFSSARRNQYNSAVAYVSSAAYISQNGWWAPDFNFCVYLRYEDEMEGVAYTRSVSVNAQASTSLNKSILFSRNAINQVGLQSQNQRACAIRLSKLENFSFTDNIQQLFRIIRSCFSTSSLQDNHSKVLDYKRFQQSLVDDEEIVARCGDNYRSFTDEIDLETFSFASRLFFRTVQTVMSVWDWIRGKIREANNVITLFCPVDLEIELECKI